MHQIWNRIEAWLKLNALELYKDLSPGANDQEIKSVEHTTGIIFPADVKSSFKIHNGQAGMAAPLMGEWQLISLNVIKKRWLILKDLYSQGEFEGIRCKTRGYVRSKWWIPEWIPVAYNGAGDYLCLDMNPKKGGKPGQIISYWHTTESREVVAASFQEWLLSFANDLETGRYTYINGQMIHTN